MQCVLLRPNGRASPNDGDAISRPPLTRSPMVSRNAQPWHDRRSGASRVGRCLRNKCVARRPQPQSIRYRPSAHSFIRCLFVDRFYLAARRVGRTANGNTALILACVSAYHSKLALHNSLPIEIDVPITFDVPVNRQFLALKSICIAFQRRGWHTGV